jgi:hypothetical protein
VILPKLELEKVAIGFEKFQLEPLGQRETLSGRQVATFGAYLACRDGGKVAGASRLRIAR